MPQRTPPRSDERVPAGDKPPAAAPAKPALDERMEELLQNIQQLSDDELAELRERILAIVDRMSSDPEEVHGEASFQRLEALAAAATDVTKEQDRRAALGRRRDRAEAAFAALVPEDRRPHWYARARRGGSADRAVTASGNQLTTVDDVSREFCDAIRRLPTDARPSMDGHKVVVATVHADRPADRSLRRSDSPDTVTDALTAAARDHVVNRRAALTAAGGLGAPEQSDYALVGFEVADRPVKTALPSFTAERGGVRFIKPPTLANVNGALGIWTVAMDEEAATNPAMRKPALRVTPSNEVVVDIQAITSTLIFGNMMGRAYPEYVQRVLDLTLAAHARIAEQQLLTQLGALSTAVTGGTTRIGATRILLPLFERAATGMRNRLRMGTNAPVQLILPDWTRPLMRSDLALQEPGDATVGVTDAELDTYFSTRGLAVTWALDGEAGQHFNPQAPNTAVADWPDRVISYLFPAGAHQFLDGGTLDLGLVRDSTLNSANDYMMFSETFEALAYRGGESLRISQPVTPSGITRAAEVAA